MNYSYDISRNLIEAEGGFWGATRIRFTSLENNIEVSQNPMYHISLVRDFFGFKKETVGSKVFFVEKESLKSFKNGNDARQELDRNSSLSRFVFSCFQLKVKQSLSFLRDSQAETHQAREEAVAEQAEVETHQAREEAVAEQAEVETHQAREEAVAEQAEVETHQAREEAVAEQAEVETHQAREEAVAEQAEVETHQAREEAVAEQDSQEGERQRPVFVPKMVKKGWGINWDALFKRPKNPRKYPAPHQRLR